MIYANANDFFDNFFNVIYQKSSGASLIEGITRASA